jgi:hypothetical protein
MFRIHHESMTVAWKSHSSLEYSRLFPWPWSLLHGQWDKTAMLYHGKLQQEVTTSMMVTIFLSTDLAQVDPRIRHPCCRLVLRCNAPPNFQDLHDEFPLLCPRWLDSCALDLL